MTSDSGISYLNALGSWKGEAEFDLGPMRSVMSSLGNPQNSPHTIHVTGTNGKGSISAALAAILGAAGNRVGLNTSPHLTTMAERVVVDGVPLSEHAINKYALEVKTAAECSRVRLTFHEAITAIAFLAFRGLDWAVIEVGLGGRLDSSNVLERPAACVIASVDYDHEQILGHTLQDIAREKAGIIKKGCLVVTGRLEEGALNVISRAAESANASLSVLGRHFECTPLPPTENVAQNTFVFSGLCGEALKFRPSLAGSHQGDNMAVVIATAKQLGLSDQECKTGIEKVFWPARLERLNFGEQVVYLDCAHNVAGVRSVISFLESQGISSVDIGFGALTTKNWKEMVELLLPVVNTWNVLTPESGMALSSGELVQYLIERGAAAVEYGKSYERFLSAYAKGGRERPLLITGSIYLVGVLRGMLVPGVKPLWSRAVQTGDNRE
jgi:dihydrofolate synthase / folylpolyglutamate synthase